MRDRLIELFKGFSIKCEENCGKVRLDSLTENIRDCGECRREQLADYLLENGVIVPPCKVGDVVYFLDFCVTAEDFGKKYIDFGKVSRLLISKYGKMCYLDTGRMFSWDGFNKNVFLNREEAEQALASIDKTPKDDLAFHIHKGTNEEKGGAE